MALFLPPRIVRSAANCVRNMKAFLQHDDSGLFYQDEQHWVENPSDALAFATVQDAEKFREVHHAQASHAVSRLDPMLLARLSVRAPGIYQVGE
jgi:hypothetical protein